MRIILYSSTNSDHLNMEVLALRELRGYDAVTFFEMAKPEYRCQGINQSPQGLAHWLAVEMIDGSAIVLHPETEPAAVMELTHVAAFLGAPLLHLKDLPEVPPVGQEAIDLFRAEFTGLHRRAVTIQKKEVPMVMFANQVLEIDDNGEVIEWPRTPREWMRDCWSWLCDCADRFNRSAFGRALKNPVSRALQEGHRPPSLIGEASARGGPRGYSLQTSKPFTTG